MIRAKKSLGQNFLKNKKIIQKIIDKADLDNEDLIFEIGPGKGALTEEILRRGNKLIVLEKDRRMINYLNSKFKKEVDEKQLKIFEGDALKIDYEKLGLVNQSFILISNLPYYITGKFLSSTLSNSIQPKRMVLMLQKEIVERITGEERKKSVKKFNKKENILSVSVKIFGYPKYLFTVSRKNFQPEPKVDSAILMIDNISKEYFLNNKLSEKEFFDFVKLSFANKRKTFLKNITKKYDKEVILKYLKTKGYSEKIRAEDLSLEDFKNIFVLLNK